MPVTIRKINNTTIERTWRLWFYTSFSISYEQFLNKPELIREMDEMAKNINPTDILYYNLYSPEFAYYNEYKSLIEIYNLFWYIHKEIFKWTKEWIQKIWSDYIDYSQTDLLDECLITKNDGIMFGDRKYKGIKPTSTNHLVTHNEWLKYTYERTQDNSLLYFLLINLVCFWIKPLYIAINKYTFETTIVDSDNLWEFLTHGPNHLILIDTFWPEIRDILKTQEMGEKLKKLTTVCGFWWTGIIVEKCKNYLQSPLIKKFTIEKENNFWTLKPTIGTGKADKLSLRFYNEMKERQITFSEETSKRHWRAEYTEFTPSIRIRKSK